MGLSINNVSMDYFLRGVDAAKPKNAPPAAAPAQVNENLPVDTTAANAGKLVAQLDMILVKAAKASTKSLDGKTVKQTFQKLVNDGALDRDSLKLLAKYAALSFGLSDDKLAKSISALTEQEYNTLLAEANALDTQNGGNEIATALGALRNHKAQA